MMFSSIKNTFIKSKAAVVVENLLETRRVEGNLQKDPSKLANHLVDVAWSSRPRVFDGGFGERPLEISIVISSLKEGLGLNELSQAERREVALALMMAIHEVQVNQGVYSFKKVDDFLINEAIQELDERIGSLGIG